MDGRIVRGEDVDVGGIIEGLLPVISYIPLLANTHAQTQSRQVEKTPISPPPPLHIRMNLVLLHSSF